MEVRYDPFDIGVAYALIGGEWVECHSEEYASLRGHTERELAIVTRELRQQNRQSGRYYFSVGSSRMARRIEGDHASEAQQLQRLQDLEKHQRKSAPAPSKTPVKTNPVPSPSAKVPSFAELARGKKIHVTRESD